MNSDSYFISTQIAFLLYNYCIIEVYLQFEAIILELNVHFIFLYKIR